MKFKYSYETSDEHSNNYDNDDVLVNIQQTKGSEMMENLREYTDKKILDKKLTEQMVNSLISIGSVLLDHFDPAFVSGILGNIIVEGARIGAFENSKYQTNPKNKPSYLKYMDELYDYGKKYSNKNIINISLNELSELLIKLKNNNWQKGKFGLGTVQWTGERTYELVKKYKEQCGNCDTITYEEASVAESKMIIDELKSKKEYSGIYNEWKKNNQKHDEKAAFNAGEMICRKYEKPKDQSKDAVNKRAEISKEIYKIITKKNN